MRVRILLEHPAAGPDAEEGAQKVRETLTFEIPGPPYGKARHRMTRTGHAYTPKETVSYESLVKHIFHTKYPDWVPHEGPVQMEISAFFDIPKSAPKKRAILMLTNALRPTKRPDTDNISKIIKDSLNGILYRDDSQVVTDTVHKLYAVVPKVEVRVMVW